MRDVISLLLKAVATLLFIHYVGHSAWWVSILISAWAVLPPAIRSTSNFRPYRVQVRAHLWPMLVAVGMIPPEQEDEIERRLEQSKAPFSCKTVMRDGVSGYFMAFHPSGEQVVHWPQKGIYTNDLSLEVPIDIFPLQGLDYEARPYPWFFIRPHDDYYHIGLQIQPSQWNVCKDNPAVSKDVMHIQETEHHVELTFAMVPICATEKYYRKVLTKRERFRKLAKDAGMKISGKEISNPYVSVVIEPLGYDKMSYGNWPIAAENETV
ncbi:hypothetical protein [Terriglobus albidus]|uniref:hypothetical protein n=1 Tax=Terriglobus albidus TaxID=1592106 RepID=UPI0021E02558|nr:hypothetical protein [Terriglobus albidus]